MKTPLRRLVAWIIGTVAGLIGVIYVLLAAGLKLSAWDARVSLEGAEKISTSSVIRARHSPHTMTLLDHGLSSLSARLSLIRSAKQSIELEFFIYDLDFSAKWITSELVERAKAGVKVSVKEMSAKTNRALTSGGHDGVGSADQALACLIKPNLVSALIQRGALR